VSSAITWSSALASPATVNAAGRAGSGADAARLRAEGFAEMPLKEDIRSVTVPGCVDGWLALHERFGRKPMKAILAPAIGYAREGFPVSDVVSYYWRGSVKKLAQYPGFNEQFTRNGEGPRKGELWKNPNLAKTLEEVAAFYTNMFANVPDPVQLTAQDEIDMVAYLKLLR